MPKSITPTPGMIIFFDWEDEEDGGVDGLPDHIGIVNTVGSTASKAIPPTAVAREVIL